jgi:hypothetical protein
VQPLERCLALNHGTYEIDLVVLIDGRTDSLIFGDEHSIVVEDAVSTVAACTTARNQVICAVIGFGVDHYHGVPHYAFFENVALFETADFLAHFRLRLTGQRTRPFSISSTTPTVVNPNIKASSATRSRACCRVNLATPLDQPNQGKRAVPFDASLGSSRCHQYGLRH